MENINNFLAAIILIVTKGSVFTKIYNWFIPALFGLPILSYGYGIMITLLVDFLLADKANLTYDNKTSTLYKLFFNITLYLIYLFVAFIIKCILKL